MIEILIIGEILLSIGLVVGGLFLYRTIAHYNKLIKGEKGKNLQSILEELIHGIDKTKKEIDLLKNEVNEVKDESLSHIQKVAVMRFNPFSDTGGDQSFILTLMDKKGDGVSLTSLHSRGVTRWYAKNVKNGKGKDHELSKEEVSAIKNMQEKL